jgi:thymidine kinase
LKLLSGSIEVVCGPMFSGKTEELIRRIRRAQIAKQKVQIFRPQIDTRYSKTHIVSHNSTSLQAQTVKCPEEILQMLRDSTRVVAIDEAQFYTTEIINIVERLAKRGLRVIVAGLDLDYKGKPFGPMPTLLALADKVAKIEAICTVCGDSASRTYRKSADSEQFLLGEEDEYEARCRSHWEYEFDNHSQLCNEGTVDENTEPLTQ